MDNIQSLTKKGSFYLPENISANLGQFDILFYVIFWLSVILFVGLLIFAFFFIISGKRQQDDQLAKKQITHNVKLEVIWTVIPTLIVIIIFFWGFKEYLIMRTTAPNALEIYVSGKKWFWEFTYPNGKKAIDELVVPANQPIKLIMSSTDVLHSFYLPNLRVKRDVIPNRYTVMSFESAKLGNYNIFCTEYCGDQHSNMKAILKVVDSADYTSFLNEVDFDESIPLSEAGANIYVKKGCNACHSVDGSNMIGPTWKGLYNKNREFADGTYAKADEVYLKESILYPQRKIVKGYQNVMPSYQGLLVDKEIDAIIEYIKELSK
jgi:cytochrome c oxidase subunit 2